MKKFGKLLSSVVVFTVVMITLCTAIFAESTTVTFTPIHEYSFDADNGNNIVDTISSGAINGTAIGTTIIQGYGGAGNARHFDGSSYITFSNNVIPVGKKSVAFKIRKASSSEIASGGGEYFFSNVKNGLTDNGIYGYFISDGRLVIACCKAGINFVAITSKNICDSNWHNILYTWDGTTNTDSVKLYADDMREPDAKTTATFTETTVGSYNFSIGALPQGIGQRFIGDIDNFQVYSSVYLNAPTNLTATAGISKVNLSWAAVDGAISYNIKRSTTVGGPYTTIAANSAITYIDTNVTNGTTYYYVVSAVANGIESLNSNEVPVTVIKPTQLKLVLEKDEQKQLSVSDNLSDNIELTWTSSDPTIATVDENGRVKALKPGNTVITCTSEDKSYTENINVLVVDLEYQLSVDLAVGDKCRLTIDDLANTTNVKWSSYDTSIANVSTKGKVTAISEGLSYIVASDKDGNELGRIYIRVRQQID